MFELVLATNNESKIKECRGIFEPYGIKIKSLKDMGVESDPIENGNSYRENAEIKAKAAWDILHVPVIADDTGLEIDAFDGYPGLYTKRFAAPEQAAKRICEKFRGRGLGIIARSALLICALCYIDVEGTPYTIEKSISGYLDTSGYLEGEHSKFDGCWPYELFTVNTDSPIRTLSDYDDALRNAISPRGLAGSRMAQGILTGPTTLNPKLTHEEILDAIEIASSIHKDPTLDRLVDKISEIWQRAEKDIIGGINNEWKSV